MKRRESITTYNRVAPVEELPESPELERAVLGALILEPALARRACDRRKFDIP